MTEDLEAQLTPGWGADGFAELADEKNRPGAWHELSGGGLPCPVRIRIDLDEAGRPICTGLLLEDSGREISSATLRGVPLRRLTTYLDAQLRASGDLAGIVRELLAAEAVTAPPAQAQRTKPGPRGPARDELVAFMRRYQRAAEEHPDRPIAAVAEDEPERRHRMSRATAHRWLRMAREQGITGQESNR